MFRKSIQIFAFLFLIVSATEVSAGPIQGFCHSALKVLGFDPDRVFLALSIKVFNIEYALMKKKSRKNVISSAEYSAYLGSLWRPYQAFLSARMVAKVDLVDIQNELRDLKFPFVAVAEIWWRVARGNSKRGEKRLSAIDCISSATLHFAADPTEIKELRSLIESWY